MQSKTKETIKYWYRGLCKLLITVVVIGMFAWVWQHYLNVLLYQRYLNKGNLLMIAVYGVLAILFIHVFGGYKIGISKRSNVILSQGIGLVCLNGVGILITSLMVGQVYYLRLIIIRYIELLVAQMQYQDPLEPTDNTEYISQLATFSSLEEMQNISVNMLQV